MAVCARTGAGLDELREALDRVAARTDSRAAQDRATRLHIDRVFTIKGAGTVVTGTLWSGSIDARRHAGVAARRGASERGHARSTSMT